MPTFKKTGSKATLKANSIHESIDIMHAITIKNNSNKLSDLDIIRSYSALLDTFEYPTSMVQYERDEYGKLHIHCVMFAPKNLSYKSLKSKGFYVFGTKVYNMKGWARYIQKWNDPIYRAQQEQRIAERYYKTHYGFRDSLCQSPLEGVRG